MTIHQQQPASGGVTISRTCLICGAPFEPFMSFGRQPIANAFLTRDAFGSEFFYELKVGACPSCRMVQLAQHVDPELMFHEQYAFFSGTSKGMTAHFAEMAGALRERYLNGPDPFVVEIGSNDGILLQNFLGTPIRHLGVEPSGNVADVARAKGIRTVSRFFDPVLAKEITAADGQADVVAAANVMCHIPDLHSVISGIGVLLKRTGALVFEDPYLGDIVEKASYDQIYDEHAFYFSVTSLQRLFTMHDMEVVDAEPQDVHGGSMRYTIRHRGAGPVSPRVHAQLQREQRAGLDRDETYADLRRRIEASRDELVALLRQARNEGKRVVGYGATSKSTTVTNYCGITSELVEFISDTTPIKQGKFSPGTHIPVRPYADFVARPPEYALLFAWNHAREILAKERPFVDGGGRFIVYVPKVGILS
jgi:methylation protein EvaC